MFVIQRLTSIHQASVCVFFSPAPDCVMVSMSTEQAMQMAITTEDSSASTNESASLEAVSQALRAIQSAQDALAVIRQAPV